MLHEKHSSVNLSISDASSFSLYEQSEGKLLAQSCINNDDNGMLTDSYGDNCDWYIDRTGFCGDFDSVNFIA